MKMETVQHMVEGLIALSIVGAVVLILLGPESTYIIQGYGGLIPDFTLDMINQKSSASVRGPVEIDLSNIDDTNIYNIKVLPKLKFGGARTEDVDVIALITFKDRSVRAKIITPAGELSKFTVSPEKDIDDYVLQSEIATTTPPIIVYETYDGPLKRGTPILIKSPQGSAMIARVIKIESYYNLLKPELKSPDCLAQFEFTCVTDRITSNYLKKCTSGGKEADCEEWLGLCGGTEHTEIRDVDCSGDLVNVQDLSYTDGKAWEDVGEDVQVSFWLDNQYTRDVSDYYTLKGCCAKYFLGNYHLNAGCLREPAFKCV